MNATPRILVVDDEAEVRLSLQELLAQEGYQVVAVPGEREAVAELHGQHFDLALIDLKLKDGSGMEVLAALRARSPDTAAIILTAFGSLETAVEALRHGAHDYLFKPCKAPELRQSVRSALLKREHEQRRRDALLHLERSLANGLEGLRATIAPEPAGQPVAPDRAAQPPHLVRRAGLVMDLEQHVVSYEGRRVDMTRTEFDLLAYLAKEAPRVISAQELIRQVQGYDASPDEAREIVRYHIYRIRQKAQLAAGQGDLVTTVRGVGYRLGG